MRRPSASPVPAAEPPDGVLLLHGIARRAASLGRMEKAFARAGYATLNLDYPARTAPLAALVARIAPAVGAVADRSSRGRS